MNRDSVTSDREAYERELAERLAALLVAGWRRRHGSIDADAQRRVQPQSQSRAPQGEVPPAA